MPRRAGRTILGLIFRVPLACALIEIAALQAEAERVVEEARELAGEVPF